MIWRNEIEGYLYGVTSILCSYGECRQEIRQARLQNTRHSIQQTITVKNRERLSSSKLSEPLSGFRPTVLKMSVKMKKFTDHSGISAHI